MKFLLIVLVSTFIIFNGASAQRDTVRLKQTYEEKHQTIVMDRAPQSVYLGIGGSGLLVSANYDRRFGKRPDGPGFTTGLGLYFGDGLTVFTIPGSLNWLLGKKNNFLEIAGGGTFVTGTLNLGDFDKSSGSFFMWHASAGYRYQPLKGGFLFRIGFCPLFAIGETVMYYYLGGGMAF